jgi:YacP-like NYN domain
MRLPLSFVASALFAVTSSDSSTKKKQKQQTTWFIDGNNLMGHKGTPSQASIIAEKIAPIEPKAEQVILVFDGQKATKNKGKDEAEVAIETRIVKESDSSRFQTVYLGKDLSADDFILSEINLLKNDPRRRVQVVTADRKLRRLVLEKSKPVVRAVINPVVFWKRYLPRLSGMKSDYTNVPKEPTSDE